MNATAPTMEQPAPVTAAPAPAVFSLAQIDASCQGPLMLLFVSGAIWLLVSSILGLLAAIKFHGPGFLAGSEWLTLGRVRPAAMNALVYGFAIQTFLGIATWIICRLGRIPLLGHRATMIGGILWNFGVTVGVLGILGGRSTGFELLEMPWLAPPFLFAGYAVMAVCALVTFHFRRETDLYVSHWYLLGGLFWFVWIYSGSVLLLLYFPVRGVMQAVVDAWYVNNLMQMWFGLLALGIVFYFAPKLLNRPLRTSTMAGFAFWMLAIFAPWSGLVTLMGGPIPAWMLSASIFANTMLITPWLAVIGILRSTLKGDRSSMVEAAAVRWIAFAAWAYVIATGVGILLGMPFVSRVTHFTWAEVGRNLFAYYGFVAMAAFGAMHYIVPRLTGIPWPSERLVKVHFRCSVVGVVLMFGALTAGGILQGFRMNLGVTDFITLGKLSAPFLGITTIGFLVLIASQAAFLTNLLKLLHVWGGRTRRAMIQAARGGTP